MAIVKYPSNTPASQMVTCTICRQALPMTHATAGRLYNDGTQAFACERHFFDSRFLLGWVDFALAQHRQAHFIENRDKVGQGMLHA